MNFNYKRIGEQVKKIRRQNNMTQANLAELTDMSDTYISRIETGAKRASLESLAKIAYILNTSLDGLVFGPGMNVIHFE